MRQAHVTGFAAMPARHESHCAVFAGMRFYLDCIIIDIEAHHKKKRRGIIIVFSMVPLPKNLHENNGWYG